MRSTPVLRLLVAAVLGLALAPGAASAAARPLPLFGVQGVPATASASQASVDAALDASRRVGAKVVRAEVLWWQLEPSASGRRDPAALAAIDRVVQGAAARGMKTLLMIDATPCWASTAPAAARGDCAGADANRFAVTRYPPAHPSDYASVAAFLVARYAPNLAAFEMWNEPDQSNEIYWDGPNKVKRYVALARATYPAIKAVAPQVPVLAGSFVGGDGKWLAALYAAGIKGSYDGLSVHFYDLPLYALTVTHALQKRHHDAKPLWLTEFGFTSCDSKGGPASKLDHQCLTRSGQAHALTDTLRAVQRVSWVKSAIVYGLYDQSNAYQFGLLTARGQVKAAFSAVDKVFGGAKTAITHPRLRLRASKGHVVASGTASLVDLFKLEVSVGGRLRYRAYVRTNRFGRFSVALPAQLGTRGLHVRFTGGWTGSAQRTR